MPKVQTLVQPFASDNVVQDLLSAANNATPAGITPSAEVIRDVNGKVVAVNVNLPNDIAYADLQNAANAINANNGVAQTLAFPVGDFVEADLDALTPNTLLAGAFGTTQVTISQLAVSLNVPNNRSSFYAAPSADAVGASGSAHEMRDVTAATSATAHASSGVYILQAIDNNLTQIGAFKWKKSVKAVDKSFNGDVSQSIAVEVTVGGRIFSLFSSSSNANLNWHLFDVSLGTLVDTGIDRFSFIDVTWELDLNGLYKLSSGAFSISHNFGFVPTTTEIRANLDVQDTFSVSQAGQQKSIISDDIAIQILSGN